MPINFELNYGQTDSQVKCLAHGSRYELLLTSSDAVLVLAPTHRDVRTSTEELLNRKVQGKYPKPASIKMNLLGANPNPEIKGLDRLPGNSNYFIGHDPKQWRTNIPNYARVKYASVYPGVDVVYYGNQRQLEYDFVVASGSDPNVIKLDIEGADNLEVDARGDLLLNIGQGQLNQLKPVVYQEVNGLRRPIAGKYVLNNKRQIGFQIGPYDRNKPLVIDPVLVYSTYLGGSGADEGAGIATDFEGNAYVVGTTDSLNFPISVGAYQSTHGVGKDVFITKLKPNGTGVIYSTYLGGSLDENGYGIAVDHAGNAYITGTTASLNFPTTSGALQTFNGGGTDAFVTRLNATGSALVYSTYLGGSGNEEGFGIVVNSAGNAYITGVTASTNFTTTSGAMQNPLAGPTDAFVTKLNPIGAAAVYSTYLGGGGADIGFAIALDSNGDSAYITGLTDSTNFPTTAGAFRNNSAGGSDAFVVKLNSGGSAATYSTLLGGAGIDAGFGIAVDSGGNAYVTGTTDSSNFPTTTGALQGSNGGGNSDAFVTKLHPGGTLLYSTYLGGSAADTGIGIALDYKGEAYVTGTTSSLNFPMTSGAPQSTFRGGNDAYLTKLNSDGTALAYSTYLGGEQDEESFGLAVDLARNAYVAGSTASSNLPTTNSAYQTTNAGGGDAFITKVANTSTAAPIDDAQYFVQQHYLDFLNRTPDRGGFDYWTSQIAQCGADEACIHDRRVGVSNAFFFELEYQQTGSYVFRLYRAAYGNSQPFPNPDTSNLVDANKLPSYAVFARDRKLVIGGTSLAQSQLDLANAFVQRQEFLSKYPASLDGPAFVDALLGNIKDSSGADLGGQRIALISLFNQSGAGSAGRGALLYRLADDNLQTNPINNRAFIDAEYNRAFVATQYFGYLRRDSDIGGFLFWLGQVNRFPVRNIAIQHALVCSFITSAEYQRRFGTIVTHSNAECPQ